MSDHPDDAVKRWFCNFYRCGDCGHEWEDEWSATCDDDCPECGARHMTPYKSEDIDPPRLGFV